MLSYFYLYVNTIFPRGKTEKRCIKMDINEAFFMIILSFLCFIFSIYLTQTSLILFLACSRTYYKKVRGATPFIKRLMFMHFWHLKTNKKILTPSLIILHWLATISFYILVFINFYSVWDKNFFPIAFNVNKAFIYYNIILTVILSICYLRIWYKEKH